MQLDVPRITWFVSYLQFFGNLTHKFLDNRQFINQEAALLGSYLLKACNQIERDKR